LKPVAEDSVADRGFQGDDILASERFDVHALIQGDPHEQRIFAVGINAVLDTNVDNPRVRWELRFQLAELQDVQDLLIDGHGDGPFCDCTITAPA
jgi:hypothetical protein